MDGIKTSAKRGTSWNEREVAAALSERRSFNNGAGRQAGKRKWLGLFDHDEKRSSAKTGEEDEICRHESGRGCMWCGVVIPLHGRLGSNDDGPGD